MRGALSILLCLGVLLAVVGCGNKEEPLLTHEAILGERSTVYLMADNGLDAIKPPWHFTFGSKSNALLIVFGFPHTIRHRFPISEENQQAIKQAIIDERFFELDELYGEVPADHSGRSIELSSGGKIHKVTLRYCNPSETYSPEERDAIERTIRIWNVLMKWVEVPDIAEFEAHDKAFMASRQE